MSKTSSDHINGTAPHSVTEDVDIPNVRFDNGNCPTQTIDMKMYLDKEKECNGY